MRFSHEFSPQQFESKPEHKARLETQIEKWKHFRNLVLEAVPSREKGVNLKRANNFLNKMRVPVKDHIFTDRMGLETFTDLSKKHNVYKHLENKSWLGGYFAELDLVIVNRSLCYEYYNGPEVSEGIYVHEQAHALTSYKNCIISKEGLEVARVGFAVGQETSELGMFLEEGWADMLRGKYMEKYMTGKMKTMLYDTPDRAQKNTVPKVTKKYTKIQGVIPSPSPIKTYELPTKYFYLVNSRGLIDHTTSALPGYSLELLCKKAPDLFETLHKARTDVSALRQVPQILDDLSPKLYLRLRALGYNMEDFLTGLNIILNEVENSPKNRPVNT
ncbi:MAG: hypothetical protein JNN11_03400 [Candidatus Doudnabacteria bacterium]|nr:hypothetical protein [Candidatus Doudnabacteria bacterium]